MRKFAVALLPEGRSSLAFHFGLIAQMTQDAGPVVGIVTGNEPRAGIDDPLSESVTILRHYPMHDPPSLYKTQATAGTGEPEAPRRQGPEFTACPRRRHPRREAGKNRYAVGCPTAAPMP